MYGTIRYDTIRYLANYWKMTNDWMIFAATIVIKYKVPKSPWHTNNLLCKNYLGYFLRVYGIRFTLLSSTASEKIAFLYQPWIVNFFDQRNCKNVEKTGTMRVIIGVLRFVRTKIKRKTWEPRIFSDEIWFHLSGYVNSQNLQDLVHFEHACGWKNVVTFDKSWRMVRKVEKKSRGFNFFFFFFKL